MTKMPQPSISFEIEIDGKIFGRNLALKNSGEEKTLKNGVIEQHFYYQDADFDGIQLAVEYRCAPGSSFKRMRYMLTSNHTARLTKSAGKDHVLYGDWKFAAKSAEEIQIGQFSSMVHSFLPVRYSHQAAEAKEIIGPVVAIEEGGKTTLIAYEHGAEAPDSYLHFKLEEDGSGEQLQLCARKGNYYHNQILDSKHPWVSCWVHSACVQGDYQQLMREYRQFFLYEISENAISRTPYIYYNTWGYQERNAAWYDRPYLDNMNEQNMLAEIDAAHQVGIDVFVIDTGWFEKTGDWTVSKERFPNGLKNIKQRLNDYNMQLGLWFNPVVGARTSKLYSANPEYAMTLDGQESWWEIWETEESTGMCLASDYADYYIKKLIELHDTLGVTYFKWDAVGQYGCNSPLHHHGTAENSAEERADCYAYQMGLAMIRIVEEVTKVCPEVIVDFDITEGKRFMGLGFLSVGKYFIFNNGPYTSDFGVPVHRDDLIGQKTLRNYEPYVNVFIIPSVCRSRFAREGLRYDEMIPSVLFLAHFFPDGPQLLQDNAAASLVLGGNGIWGNLQDMQSSDRQYMGEEIKRYKKVAQSVTESYPIHTGTAASSPEIFEKISEHTGEGVVSFFTCSAGTFTYRTQSLPDVDNLVVQGCDKVRKLSGDILELTVTLPHDGARLVTITKDRS